MERPRQRQGPLEGKVSPGPRTPCYFHGWWVPPSWAHAPSLTIISVAQHHRHTLSQTRGWGGWPIARTMLCPQMPGPRYIRRCNSTHAWDPELGAREVGTQAGVLASRVRPEVERNSQQTPPSTMPAGSGWGAGEGRAEGEGGWQTRGADCVWEQKDPPPAMIVPLQWETTGGETLPEAERKTQALRHPLLGGWGASATLRYTKEMGSLPETHLTPGRQTRRDWGLRTTPKVSKATR